MNFQIGGRIMDERSYSELKRRRHELVEELRAIEEILQAYERLQKLRNPNSAAEAAPKEPKPRERNIYSPRRIAEFARSAILDQGRPLTRGELVDALDSKGVTLVGVDKAKNVGTIMWRFRNQFQNIPGRGYWPTDMPRDDDAE